MNFKQFLNERYYKSFKHHGNTIEVFKNPNSNDILELKKHAVGFNGNETPDGRVYLRYIADAKNKVLYLFDSNIHHYHVWQEIKDKRIVSPNGMGHDESLIMGLCEIKGMSLISDTEHPNKKYDWKWLSKYMNIDKIKPL